MKTVLLVEDSVDTQLLIKNLIPECQWVCCQSVAEAKLALKKETERFVLAIIDIGLPDGDGLELFSELKNDPVTQDLPAIFLTAHGDLPKKVMAFSLGSEDFIQKPFEPVELRARVLAKVRKFTQLQEEKEQDKSAVNQINYDNVVIDFTRQKVLLSKDGKADPVDLTSKEFKLLSYLMQRAEQVLSREALLDEVWGTNTFVVDRTIDSHISRLRKKLKDSNVLIESIAGEGYRLTHAAQP